MHVVQRRYYFLVDFYHGFYLIGKNSEHNDFECNSMTGGADLIFWSSLETAHCPCACVCMCARKRKTIWIVNRRAGTER